MKKIDYNQIIRSAWEEFDNRHEIKGIYDVSAHVSTNQVYKISFFKREPVFVKLSDYGKFDDFKEDHIIINNLANNLESPYQNFLAKALIKKNELFIYRYHQENHSAWVIFYNPIDLKARLPRKLEEKQIRKLGRELARFHLACTNVKNQLPNASKNETTDMYSLLKKVQKNELKICKSDYEMVKKQCGLFFENANKLNYFTDFEAIPVFVDWNIGNFSVTPEYRFYSRWDYDWFRISSRILDFYFFSRVVSSVGDRTVFSYLAEPLMEERFMIFLKEYHSVFPLTVNEIYFIKEAYRFFILNYVIKDGPIFFSKQYAAKLTQEAFSTYFPSVDAIFNAETILKNLNI